MVIRYRSSLIDFHLGCCPGTLGNFSGGKNNFLMNFFLHILIECANGTGKKGFFGNNIFTHTGLNSSNRNDSSFFG